MCQKPRIQIQFREFVNWPNPKQLSWQRAEVDVSGEDFVGAPRVELTMPDVPLLRKVGNLSSPPSCMKAFAIGELSSLVPFSDKCLSSLSSNKKLVVFRGPKPLGCIELPMLRR